jgi:hypothetical protein
MQDHSKVYVKIIDFAPEFFLDIEITFLYRLWKTHSYD